MVSVMGVCILGVWTRSKITRAPETHLIEHVHAISRTVNRQKLRLWLSHLHFSTFREIEYAIVESNKLSACIRN